MSFSEKTALVLSGGGAKGAYEVGVWQALKEMDIRIDIVTGTSIGALNGAVIVQDIFETASSFWQQLETEQIFDLKEAVRNGGISYSRLRKTLIRYIDEDTIRKSPVDFGFVTVELNTMTPKYLWKEDVPKGDLVDYILASASCFPAVQTYEIGANRYIDGGYTDNMPVGMALEKGAQRIISVDLNALGIVHKDVVADAKNLVLIESAWDLGNFLIFDKDHTKHIMRLGYLDTLKAFDAYDGRFFCFIKGQIDRRSLKSAEMAARIFELNPEIIYSREVFHNKLREAIGKQRAQEDQDITGASQKLTDTLWAGIAKVLSQLSNKSLILAMAEHLLSLENGEKSIVLSRPAKALFSKEIGAAQYLVKEKLI